EIPPPTISVSSCGRWRAAGCFARRKGGRSAWPAGYRRQSARCGQQYCCRGSRAPTAIEQSGARQSRSRTRPESRRRSAQVESDNLEDQSNDLVASADSGEVDPRQMKIGIILTEDIDSQELERWFGGEQPLQPEEYADDGSVKVTRLEADNSVTLVTPAKQEPVAPAVKSPVRDANAPQPPAYDR